MKIEITPTEAITLLKGLNQSIHEWLVLIDNEHKTVDARNLTNEESRKLFMEASENLDNIKEYDKNG